MENIFQYTESALLNAQARAYAYGRIDEARKHGDKFHVVRSPDFEREIMRVNASIGDFERIYDRLVQEKITNATAISQALYPQDSKVTP